MYSYIYIYIYMCVCVCVCVYISSILPVLTLNKLIVLLHTLSAYR